jgi:hypothetical protein
LKVLKPTPNKILKGAVKEDFLIGVYRHYITAEVFTTNTKLNWGKNTWKVTR